MKVPDADTFSLNEVAVPLCSIARTSVRFRVLGSSLTSCPMLDRLYQSLLDQVWDTCFCIAWFDSEAVFLGSLVILGGFVAMGQRVKDICV